MLPCSALLLPFASAYTLPCVRGAPATIAGTPLPLKWTGPAVRTAHESACRTRWMEPEEGWGIDNLMGMMEDAEKMESNNSTDSTPVAADAADDGSSKD